MQWPVEIGLAMEYPHWLIVAGAIMVVFGFIGLAFRRLASLEPLVVSKKGQSDLETQITQANRNAMLAEQTKDRWAQAKPPPD